MTASKSTSRFASCCVRSAASRTETRRRIGRRGMIPPMKSWNVSYKSSGEKLRPNRSSHITRRNRRPSISISTGLLVERVFVQKPEQPVPLPLAAARRVAISAACQRRRILARRLLRFAAPSASVSFPVLLGQESASRCTATSPLLP